MTVKPNSIKAVVFDLWETLVPFPKEVKQRAFNETSAALEFRPEELKGPWESTRMKRETGDLYEYLSWLNIELDSKWSDKQIQLAMTTRKKIHGSAFKSPDQQSFEVLAALKEMRIKTALVSNCSSDVRELLSTSALMPLFDEIILSAEVGMMKPNRAIFEHAASRINVHPSECLYVGDGHDHELEGAKSAGMKPILIDRGADREWKGTTIDHLSEILKEVTLVEI